MTRTSSLILTVIVTAQFLCTSLWFAGNAILPDLVMHLQIPAAELVHMISAVQFGFITGTLTYAVFLIADRFLPSQVFFWSALLAAAANMGIGIAGNGIVQVLLLRFLTGFFLAGIYPVGMKIASDHFEKGLGKALGFLVGALVVGTALPHAVKSLTGFLHWKTVLYITSGFSVVGGTCMLLLVPAGPFQHKMQSFRFIAAARIFKNRPFRSAVLGYFGHMWELYAFWAFVPFLLMTYMHLYPDVSIHISLLSFYIIAGGGFACVAGGYLSQIFGAKKTAFVSLFLSGCCCLFSPLAFYLPLVPFLIFLFFWGLVVIADSPLFSSLVAGHADAPLKGTVLTLVTCIGFSITIASIELINYLSAHIDHRYIFLVLAVGPVSGLLCMLPLHSKKVIPK